MRMQGVILHSEPCASGSDMLDLTPTFTLFLNTSQRERIISHKKGSTHEEKKSRVEPGCDDSAV